MNVIVFNGSPHKDNGVTAAMIRHLNDGFEEAGANVETYNLYEMNVKPCLGCVACWLKTPGRCVHDDDVSVLYPKLSEADVVVFATPVYVDGMTGAMKAMLDRLVPLVRGPVEVREGHVRHVVPPGRTKTKLLLVSGSGFPEMDNFDPLVSHVKAACKNLDWEYAGALLRPYGLLFPMLESRGVQTKCVYQALRSAAIELKLNGYVSEETSMDVAKELSSRDEVVKDLNAILTPH